MKGSSSLLTLTKQGELFTHHKNESIPILNVEVRRLDSIFKKESLRSKKTMLKIDVQGFELQVLNGFGDLIKEIPLIEIEIPIIDLYSGSTLLPELLIYFRNLNFELCTIQTERFSGFAAADVDVLFIKSDIFKELTEERALQK